MAVVHRDFDEGSEPLPPSCSFKLGGRKWTCRHSDDVPYGLVKSVFSAQGDPGQLAVQIEPFFRGVLVSEEVEAFAEMLNAPDSSLTIGKLAPLVQYVAENVLSRPTKPAAGSSSGSKSTGRSSAVGSSSRATTRRRSA